MSHMIWKIRRPIFWELLFYSCYQGTNLALPLLFKQLFDHLDQLNLSFLGLLLLLYLILIVANSGFQYLTQYFEWVVERDFQICLRQGLFNSHLQSQDTETGQLLAVFQNDVADLTSNYLEPRISLVKSGFALVSYSVVLAYVTDWRITLVAFGSTLLSLALPKRLGEPLARTKEQSLLENQRYLAHLKDLLEGWHLMTPETQPAFQKSHQNSLEVMQNKRLTYGRHQTLANVLSGVSMFSVQFAAFTVVVVLLYQEQLSLGSAVATFSYVNDYVYPVRYLLNDLNLMTSMTATVQRFKQRYMMTASLPISQELTPSCLETPDFTLKAGDVIALVGKSGAGKSTYLDRIAQGRLGLWDKQTISPEDFTGFAFYARQQGHLFAQSFWDNLTVMGTYPISERITAFLPLLSDEIIKASDVTQLSGGEQQLVRLAQALNSGKTFLFLDEVLTGVDKTKSRQVMSFLTQQKSLAILMITHDTSVENLSLFSQVITLSSTSD